VPQFFGKYRGKVVANADPLGQGRVQVSVPAVLGEGSLAWAMPCVPYAGPGVGLFLVPPVEASVWVEFERGESKFPILAGCFWSEGELFVDPPEPQLLAFKCDGVSVLIDASTGGSVKLSVSSPIAETEVHVVIDADGVVIETGQGKLAVSSSEVAINRDGLVVK
jgi:hypothetical protein